MRVLVTGGAGFVGFFVCKNLLERGYEVTALDNLTDNYDCSLKLLNIADLTHYGGFGFFKGDVRNGGDCLEALRDCSAVVHLAAMPGVRQSQEREEEYYEVNVRGTANLLASMARAGVATGVLASSSAVYGNVVLPYLEEGELRPLSPYGQSKRLAEELWRAAQSWGLSLTAARMFSVYGPRQRPDLALRLFAGQILRGDPIHLWGNCSRDYTYAEDAAEGLSLCLLYALKRRGFEIFNLGRGESTSTADLIDKLSLALRKKAIVTRQPPNSLDAKATRASIKKAQELLGYAPQTSLDDGIARFVAWLKGG